MKRNIMITICCTLILCLLSGCQLAKESIKTDSDIDRLIGVFVTKENLDLFILESGLYENSNSSQGRLYAVLIKRALTNEETGEIIVTDEYIFDGIKGIQYCVPIIQATETENSYLTTMSDPAIYDAHTSIFAGEDENSLAIDGTIFVIPSSNMDTYYFNPIYQSEDGSVYAVSGDSFIFSSEAFSEGQIYSQTMENTITITENGKSKKDSTSIKISFSVMFAPVKIVVLQMGADNVTIVKTEYKPEEMPENLTLKTSTDYFIVETYKRDNLGNIVISREIYGREVESIKTFFARTDGIVENKLIQITSK